jgi:MFS family permease
MAIPLLHATIGLEFWQLLVLVFLGALLDMPGYTARQSLFPDLAEQAGIPLERANGFYSITGRISGLLGPPLAGVLIAFLGPSNVLWIDAATFAVSALLVAMLVPAGSKPTEEPGGGESGSYFEEVRAGFRFLRNDPVLLWLIIVLAIGSLLAEPLYGIILPVYAREELGGSVDLGLAFAALAAGSIAGNILYLLVGPRVPRRIILIVGIAMRALTFWVLLALPPLWIVAASIFINALFLEPLNPLIMTIFQERVPAGMRGRVFGASSALSSGAQPLGLLGYGLLIDGAGLYNALIVLAVVNLAMPLAAILAPALRGIERPQPIAVGIPPGTPLGK